MVHHALSAVAHYPNFSGGRCLAPSWHPRPVTEGFSFLLLSAENVIIIDDDSFTHSKTITDRGREVREKNDVWVADVDVDEGVPS